MHKYSVKTQFFIIITGIAVLFFIAYLLPFLPSQRKPVTPEKKQLIQSLLDDSNIKHCGGAMYVDYACLNKNAVFSDVYNNPMNYLNTISELITSRPISDENLTLINNSLRKLPVKVRFEFIEDTISKIAQGKIRIQFSPSDTSSLSQEYLINSRISQVAIPMRGEKSYLRWYFWHPVVREQMYKIKKDYPNLSEMVDDYLSGNYFFASNDS